MFDGDEFFLERIVVGPIQVNCYLFGCTATKEALLIDPGDEPEKIQEAVEQRQAKVVGILLTHGHYDHIGALNQVREHYGCPVMIHSAEADSLTDPRANLSALTGEPLAGPPAERLLNDNDIVEVGKLQIAVFHTPGHSPGGISLHYNGIVIAGDLIFQMSIGRTDLPGGSFSQLEDSIRNRIYTLPDETLIYPGHGEKTTVGFEKRHNQFVPER